MFIFSLNYDGCVLFHYNNWKLKEILPNTKNVSENVCFLSFKVWKSNVLLDSYMQYIAYAGHINMTIA